MEPHRTVVMFARAPRAGTVKTRLARTMGDPFALNTYRWLGARIASTLARAPRSYRLVVACDPPDDASLALMRAWLPEADAFWLQGEGDLGARMARAIDRARTAPGDRVVLIGADCPAVDRVRIEAAFDALATAPCVLGPAFDGGYYLLGARERLPVFEAMPWSTDRVLAETEARLTRAGIAWHTLPREHDIDTEDDLDTLRTLDDVPAWLTPRETAPEATENPPVPRE